MPKYLKDTKLEIWKDTPSYQDDSGAWHHGGSVKAGEVWANVKGTDYSREYALSAAWDLPIFKVTITRPTWDVSLGDHVCYKGRYYVVKTIDELTGKVGRDMKLVVQLDNNWVPSA